MPSTTRRDTWLGDALPAATLAVALGLVLLGGRLPTLLRVASQVEPVIAVVLPGVSPAGFDALGLLPRLQRPNPAEMRWLGGDLIDVPGASGDRLWRRAVTGRIEPEPDDPDLLARAGIPVYGEWLAPADTSSDREHLARARLHVQGDGASGRAAIVVLSCSQPVAELAAGPCRSVFVEAVGLLEEAARRGGTGLLLAVPLRGFPQIGTVWAIGPEVQEGVDFRFRMIDVAPTMLRMLQLPAPPAVDGGPAYDMMGFTHLFHRPLRWEGGGT
jgi:hypothetical protein